MIDVSGVLGETVFRRGQAYEKGVAVVSRLSKLKRSPKSCSTVWLQITKSRKRTHKY